MEQENNNQTQSTENISSQEQFQTSKKRGAGIRSQIKTRFSAKRVALMGTFVALAFLVSLLDFPVFPSSPVAFLKLDFGNVFILLPAFLLGPVEGVIVCVLKETIRIMAGSTGGVGEVANMLATSAYILLPSIVYRYRKGIKTVAITLAGACLIGTAAALLANRFITFPAFMGEQGVVVFKECFWLILIFNLIKTISVGIVTLLLYKRMSNFLKKIKI